MIKDVGIFAAFFLIAFLLSTWAIRWGILKHLNEPKEKPDPRAHAVGFWIGFCETLIIFLFVSVDEYGALAIILGAKEFVRQEKIKENASYYLLGTLVNLTIALLCVRVAILLTETR